MPDRLNIRYFAYATIIPVVMMLVAMWFKPLWRDELFSVYYAESGVGLTELAKDRWALDAHPPIHNVFLWAWSHISDNVFFQKCLSLLFLIAGIVASYRVLPIDDKRRLHLFWLTCLGSYWVIYFATEIRPYVLNFTLSALITLLSLDILKKAKPGLWIWIGWLLVGAVLSLTHYFGALWTACLGFAIGLSKLKHNDARSFFKMGLISVLSLVPVLCWIYFVSTNMDITGRATDLSTWDKFSGATHQFLRGLLIKTFGSNPLITWLGFGGLLLAIKGRNRHHQVLMFAIGLTVLFAFALHLVFVDMIKERAFIVIMPALIWIMVDHLSRSGSKLLKYVPVVTAIMPFLFVPEYFKNKERFDALQAAFASYGKICETSDLYVHYREGQPQGVHAFAARYILSPNGERRLVDLNGAQFIPDHNCPIKAVAILQKKNDTAMIQKVSDQFSNQSPDIVAQQIGKGRTVIWISQQE